MSKYGLDDLQIADQAKSLQHNTLLAGILDDMQNEQFDLWLSSAHDDVEGRERCHAHFIAVTKLRQIISNSISLYAGETTETEEA